jgi:hypothetical protein
MDRQSIRLTREELYEKMWSRPAIALAEEFGISGRGLGKFPRTPPAFVTIQRRTSERASWLQDSR